MKINRRNLIKVLVFIFLGALLILLAIYLYDISTSDTASLSEDPVRIEGSPEDEDLFVDKSLGISIAIPEGWTVTRTSNSECIASGGVNSECVNIINDSDTVRLVVTRQTPPEIVYNRSMVGMYLDSTENYRIVGEFIGEPIIRSQFINSSIKIGEFSLIYLLYYDTESTYSNNWFLTSDTGYNISYMIKGSIEKYTEDINILDKTVKTLEFVVD